MQCCRRDSPWCAIWATTVWYADTALRQAIEQGWVPGPTLINSGIIIGGIGGSSSTPEMVKEHNIVYPEYLDADTHDEIVKAVRQNVFSARR